MKNHPSKIKDIANEFAIPGDFISGVEIDSGHINSTYLVEFGSDDEKKSLSSLANQRSSFSYLEVEMHNVEIPCNIN